MVEMGMKRRRLGVLAGLFIWAVLGVLPLAAASGAAGDLDTSFGSAGVAVLGLDAFNTSTTLLGIQSDGKHVLATNVEGPVLDGVRTMSWLIYRRQADGSADSSFGTNGEVRLFGQFRSDEFSDGVVDSSDRIICVGRVLIETTTTSGKGRKQKTKSSFVNAFTVVRLLANGALDSGFGSGGAVHTPIPGATNGDGQAFAVAVQGNGKIVAGGRAREVSSGGGGGKKRKGGTSTSSDALVVVRYHSDGTLDGSFGTAGVTVHDASTQDDRLRPGCLGVQASGKIVLGSFVQAGGADGWVVTRYGADGSIDTGFGRVTPVNHYINGLQVDSSDRILAVGSRLDASGDREMVVARYLAGGTLDSGFGSGGYASTGFGEYARGFAAAIQSDGKVVAMSAVGEAGSADVEAIPVRFSAAGILDAAGFGIGGHGQALGASGLDVYPLFELELDSSGNLVIAGASLDPSDNSAEGYLARWCGN